MAYCALQSGADAGFPSGRQHYWKSAWLTDLSDAAIEWLLGSREPAIAVFLTTPKIEEAANDTAFAAEPVRR